MDKKQNNNLDKEFEYYLANQDELVKKYNNKFLVIKDKKVVGYFDTSSEAFLFGSEKFEAGSFLIQFCSTGKSSYTQTFHSRVVFN